MARSLLDRRRLGLGNAAQFIGASLIWSSTWLVIKGQLGEVPLAWSVAYRFILAGTLMIGFCLATGRWRRPSARVHLFALVSGVAQFALNYNLVYAAEAHLTSGLVAVIFALVIVPNAILARVFLDVPITLRFVVGAALATGGLGLIFARDLVQPGFDGAATGYGLMLAVLATLSASVVNVMQANSFSRTLPAMPTLGLSMLYGGCLAALYAATVAGPPVFDLRPAYWLGLLVLAVLGSIVAFSLYYNLIQKIGPGRAGYVNVVVPVLAMALSTVFENYIWSVEAVVGTALAMIGLVIALRGRT